MTAPACPFCRPDPARVFHDGDLVLGLWDAYPVSPGHALLVPKRHVPTWFEATRPEQDALVRAIDAAKAAIEAQHRPDGYNIGINAGEAAGQTVLHLHLHVIPRYRGDVPDPRGGVRHVIPGKGNYLVRPPEEARDTLSGSPHDRSIITGGADPFLPHLVSALDGATRADIAVAFVLPSGVDLIIEHLRDLLRRGGRLRFLTGDYQDVTDPDALEILCDLSAEFPIEAVDLRVYETAGRSSFHPKAYILYQPDGPATAFVGSSNVSETALQTGIEWNFRRVTSPDQRDFAEVREAFERLFSGPGVERLDHDWIRRYRACRRPALPVPIGVAPEPPPPPPQPHDIQREALAALERTREEGNSAGLVVLATGLGKTWLAAFDACRPGAFGRVLFVAHREEILGQAMQTFRRIRPEAKLGRYTGTEKVPDADVLFASVQTLGRLRHLGAFPRDAFDYIVVDEFHHAAARTYRNLIAHFRPKFLLGLTATPERTDGGDLLALCQQNLVYRCDLFDGIRRGLLCPFRYFGVPDDVDYANIPWRSGRFDEEALTQAVATRARAQNALEQWRARGGKRTLAFCVSQRHASFMARFFAEAGIRAVAVHSGHDSAPRATSLERLGQGELDVVFSVDMFNEGVDVPNVDTVLMLRPTESTILWTQQFGRGLRRAYDKTHLTVIDYIGNHRIFLNKPRTLFGLRAGDREIEQLLDRLDAGQAKLPPGCEVTYDLEAKDILRSLLRHGMSADLVEAYYRDFRDRHGRPPVALEAYEEGYNPRKTGYAHWYGLVRAMGDLTAEQEEALAEQEAFLAMLPGTPMTKSYKMLVLLAMLDNGAFPGSIDIDTLADSFAALAGRSAILRADVSMPLDDRAVLCQLLESNPISAWAGGKGTGDRTFFTYENGRFATTFSVDDRARAAFQEMVRDLADWRLAEYLDRARGAGAERIICKVTHQASGQPILMLPDRQRQPGIPQGWTDIVANGRPYQANFVKIAVNVVRDPSGTNNVLPELLRGWYGPDAGKSGTTQRVAFERDGEVWKLGPERSPDADRPLAVWQQYRREEIPPLFGLTFRESTWRQGIVSEGGQLILLVTLEKADLAESARFDDRFLSPTHFQWQSQNRTKQTDKVGRLIRDHAALGIPVHLFVRRTKLLEDRAAPFVYCGEVEFSDWDGEQPITVRWRLREAVPERLRPLLKVPS